MAFDSELPILLPHDAGDLDPKGARLTIGGQTIEVIAYALLLGRGAIHNSSLRRLNVFRTVVDCGGVNAAAEHLDISQPSVTAHLRALETQLGSSLFMRNRGRRNIITPTGQALYKYACDALSKSAELQATIRRFDPAAAQTVAIAAHRALASRMMPSALATFLRERPDARISVYSESQSLTMKLLAEGRVDAVIAFASPKTNDYAGVMIGSEPLQIIAAPTHPLAKQKSVALADLEHFDFVAGLQESEGWAFVDTMLEDSGFRKRRIILRMQGADSVNNAVIHGIGLACTIASAARQGIAEGKLVALKTEPALRPVPIKWMIREDSMCRELLEAFIPALVAAQNA